MVGDEDYRPGTVGGWRALLHDLTVDELETYAGVARDQIAQERAWAVAHVALFALSIGAIVLVAWDLSARGFQGLQVYGAIAAFLLAYWPYRAMRTRRLWQSHITAVTDELAKRRRNDGDQTEDTPQTVGSDGPAAETF